MDEIIKIYSFCLEKLIVLDLYNYLESQTETKGSVIRNLLRIGFKEFKKNNKSVID